ncbi:hypothetical protein HQQ94_11640 [Shewanella sp. VB17]|uniref:hypothetical protein n=1 Tax=Shewanella sp. VB17 TaxID=2739432 RepID=UPI0015659521|nr:hypothetical protein [Shewanella sp. VB17]NRD73875.1 hypothetical protein [Shewanella sp. VB17]
MNKFTSLILLTFSLLLSGCGGSSSEGVTSTPKNDPVITDTPPPVITNDQAPVITLSEHQQAQGGQSMILIASVKDPQNDKVTVEWQAENNDIRFSDKKSLTTTLTLPDVTTTLMTMITLTATDSGGNQSKQTLKLTIVPNDVDKPTVYIELLDKVESISGNVVTLSAKLTHNVAIDAIIWDLSSLDITDTEQTEAVKDNITTSTVTFTAPNVNKLTEYPIKLTVTTDKKAEFSQESRLFVALDNSNELTVSLPENIEINEYASTEVTPTINSTQVIDSYQWRWISDHNASLSLITPKNKILSVFVPATETDIQGQLQLTVVSGDVSRTVTTEVSIKNTAVISDVTLSASRLVAVKGQQIVLNVMTDNPEQIKEWSWEVDKTQGSDITESKQQFEITVPKVSGQQIMSIVYRATLIDGREVQKVVNITLLSEWTGRDSFTYDSFGYTLHDIDAGSPQTVTLTFKDPHHLVDVMTLEQLDLLDKVELIRAEDQVIIVLQINETSTVDRFGVIRLKVVYGDYSIPLSILLNIRAANP